MSILTALTVAVTVSCGLEGNDVPVPHEAADLRGTLLITVDTLRADAIGAYEDSKPTPSPTPHIDALARRGTLFENAVAPMPLTRPSHFSILTSRYPREHGVVNNAIALPDSARTLAEILSDAGLRTAGFTAVVLLDEGSGAAQGFDQFTHPTKPRARSAGETVREAREWLRGLAPDERFFLWVHLFDPHLPYEPPESFAPEPSSAVEGEWASLDWPEFYALAEQRDGDVPAWALEHAQALYRAEVSYTDDRVGALLGELAALGRDQSTLVVFTADHGEAFENGTYFEHADSLYDGAIRVPLIVARPGVFPEDRRVDTQVSSLDVAPTVLEAFGIERPAEYVGRPLQSLARADQAGERWVLVQHPLYQERRASLRPKKRSVIRSVAGDPLEPVLVGRERVGLVGRDWKLVRTGDVLELFDRRSGEQQDLAAENPQLRDRMSAQLERELRAHPLHLIEVEEINAQLLDSLRALGYAD